ncbi:TIGR02281 family clan AA aspartic protease [Rhodobacteraceae bacterium 2CG4]|uniref:TIGR02281 family clan AA aspartic protease n=1 Tax=Halovulum marinum TaxID=2662447 RepID=A0A6L5Z1A9_9RHOB|nr:TIGR02281 family clan AA aspartic protease [Halovulum marinum]MSU89872.1 TIGR02281 family clan AA aspartic protease [Halovulum marinum]
MTGDDYARLVYLALLLAFIGGFALSRRRRGRAARGLQQALIWIGIFAAFVVLYGQRDVLNRELFPREARQLDERTIALNRTPSGSFLTTAEVNGVRVRFLIDTGATDIVLTMQDAARAGFDQDALRFIGRAATANGTVRTANVRLDTLAFAGRTDRDVPASVNEGELGVSLLGMSYLNRFERIEIRGDQMLLVEG